MGTSQNGTQWSSVEYVIEELNQQYPSRAVIQVYGSDKIQQFGIQVGEIITANIGLKAHQARDGRWFNQLDCWKVERPSAQQQGYSNPPQPAPLAQQMQRFPPQVDAYGHPISQNQNQYAAGQQTQAAQQGLPFPAPNQQ